MLHLYNGDSNYVSNIYATAGISVSYGGTGLNNPAGEFTFNFPKLTDDNHTAYFAITTDASGIAVEANPAAEATESLSKVRIENKVYSVGGGSAPTTRSSTSRAIYTHTISIARSNISYAIKLFTDTDTEITSATALWSALDSSLNAMYIKSENERNIIFDFSKDSSGNITLYYLDASSSMSIEVDTEDLISDNVS